LSNLLHHPIYAGAYTFGRRQIDAKRKQAGRPTTGRVVVPTEKWLVLIKDQFPSYISWEQYLRNQKQLESNQNRAAEIGAIRHGPSILAGLVVCGRCGRRMSVRYSGPTQKLSYACVRQYIDYGNKPCQSLSGEVLNRFVSEQVLKALEPASIELSLRAAQNVEQERKQLEKIYEQRLERARYEAERAARQYRIVEPENRLVARQLEHDWESKLQEQKSIEQECERFRATQPKVLSEKEREEIRQLADAIPALWHGGTINEGDRKSIIRQLVERVEVDVIGDSEQVRVKIQWAGVHKSEHTIIRPVACWEQLSQYDSLKKRLEELTDQGLTSGQIAEKLNQEGWKPPKRSEQFRAEGVRKLLVRMGLSCVQRSSEACKPKLKKNEWWIPDLADKLGIPQVTLTHWIYREWVTARQLDGRQGRWIVWADDKEIKRLEQLRDLPRGYWSRKHFFEGKGKKVDL